MTFFGNVATALFGLCTLMHPSVLPTKCTLVRSHGS